MKTTIGIILGVILGIIIIFSVVVVWVLPNISSALQQASGNSATPPPGIAPSPRVNQPTGNPTILPSSIDFNLVVTSVAGSGLSRTVTAQLVNNGSADAHNAWVKVAVTSNAAKLKINNQDYLRVDLGTVKAKTTVTRQVKISFSALDAPRVLENGATFNLTIYSDEKTQTFSYDYHP